jgi:quercetin dioxygenase-like cupin family protein
MGNFMLRLRKLTIAPHGVVPTHAHNDRPSIVHIVEGEIVEHNAFCAVPIIHKPGDTTPESGAGHIHWWENTTDKPVVIFSTDVVPFEKQKESMM